MVKLLVLPFILAAPFVLGARADEVVSPWVQEQKDFFKVADGNSDGQLSTTELQAYFSLKVGAAWGTDGELTYTAFYDVHNMLRHKTKGGKLRGKLHALLADGSSGISKAALTTFLKDKEGGSGAENAASLASAYMQAHEDLDGNGKLSWSEFFLPAGSAAGPKDEL